MMRLIAWQAWQRTVRRPVTIRLRSASGKPASPPKLRCYPHSAIGSSVLYCGFNEYQDMHFAADILASTDIFVDVGANIGIYSLLGASIPGVEVIALEPSTRSRNRLIENVALNDFDERIQVVAAAAGASSGSARLTEGFDAMNRIVDDSESSAPTEAVEVVTLDNIVPAADRNRVTLVKIDVEGHESEVIDGALELLSTGHPHLIVEALEPGGIRERVEVLGYRPYRYEPAKRDLREAGWDETAGNNLLLISDLGHATDRLS